MTYALGIDLGTTYTAAAVARDGRGEVATLGYRATSVPSVVFLAGDGQFLVAEAAERRAAHQPERVAREFKRRVGDPTPLLLGGAPVPVDRCLAEVLRWIVATVGGSEGGPPGAVTVTHPANWSEFKRDVLREALRLVDIRNSWLLPEPVAAATWYAQAERLAPGCTIAVYDLGGGTFDTAVLRRRPDGQFESLGHPEGIERLGGIDIDEAVMGYVLRAVGEAGAAFEHGADDPALRTAIAQLRRSCVEAKEALSAETSVAIPVWLPGGYQEVRMNRTELEELVEPLLRPTIEALGRVVDSAGLRPHDLDAVLLVGGSSRIPLIAQQVSAGFGRPIAVDAHPKHPVALGAALDAAGHLVKRPSVVPVMPPAQGSAAPVPGFAPTPGASSWGTQPGPAAAAAATTAVPSPTSMPGPAGRHFRTSPSHPSGPSLPALPQPRVDSDSDVSNRRVILFASLVTPVVMVLMVVLFVLQARNPPGGNDATSGSTVPTVVNPAAEGGPAVTTASTAPAALVNLLTTDATPAINAFAGIYGGTPPRVRELVLYPDSAYIDVQVPDNPTYVDEYNWDASGITGPEPVQLLDMEVDELEAKLFDLSEVDPAVIPSVTQQMMQNCPGEGLELTHVIIERDIDFDDQQRVLLSVYASHPERGGGGYIQFTPDGTLVENYCD